MTPADLERAMQQAADALDFEEARRLRDRLAIARQTGADPGDTAGLVRQQPGAMGIGTSRSQVETPDGWVKPARPDPLTKGRKRRD